MRIKNILLLAVLLGLVAGCDSGTNQTQTPNATNNAAPPMTNMVTPHT
jgi:uncharacterized lipoprotein